MRRGSRNGASARGANKHLPRGRQWINQMVLRKDAMWGKDWFPGKVTQWNEVTNKHHIVYEKTTEWEEFDEWINLDKAPVSALRWEGELPGAEDDDDEEDEEEDPDSEPADMKIVTKGGHPSKKQRTSGSDMLSIMPVQEKLAYVNDKLAGLKRDTIPPVATLNEVEAFENAHQITLPTPYREFLLKVGNGGDGPPKQGLVKLGQKLEDQKYKLNKEFPFQASDLPDASLMYVGQQRVFTTSGIPGDSKKPVGKELTLAKQFNDAEWGGLLLVGSDGEEGNYYLVVSGPDKGNVWLLAEDFFGPQEMDFLDWYAYWLDRQCPGASVASGCNRVFVK